MSQTECKNDGDAHPKLSKMTLDQLFSDKTFQAEFSNILSEYAELDKKDIDNQVNVISTVMNGISGAISSVVMGLNLQYFIPKFKEQQSKLSLIPDLSKVFNIDFKNVVNTESLDWKKVSEFMESPCDSLCDFAKTLKDKCNCNNVDENSFRKYVCEQLNEYKSWLEWDIKTISNGLLCVNMVCQLFTIATTMKGIYNVHKEMKRTSTLQKLIDHKLDFIRNELSKISKLLLTQFKFVSECEESMKRIAEKLSKCDVELQCIIETINNEKNKSKSKRNSCIGGGLGGLVTGVTGIINSSSLYSLSMVNPVLGISAISLSVVQCVLGATFIGQGVYINFIEIKEWDRLEKKAHDTLVQLKKIQNSEEFKKIDQEIDRKAIYKSIELNIIKNAFKKNNIYDDYYELIVIKNKCNNRNRLKKVNENRLLKWNITNEFAVEEILDTVKELTDIPQKNADNSIANTVNNLCTKKNLLNAGVIAGNVGMSALAIHKMVVQSGQLH